MPSLTRVCTPTVALLGMVLAVGGCRTKADTEAEGYKPGTTASPYASPAPGAYGTTGTTGSATTVPTQVLARVLAVDTKASSITVTSAPRGSTADQPGEATPGEGTGTTASGTAGAIANRRTIPVDAAATADLERVKAGDKVTLVCSESTAVTPGTATGTTGTAGTTATTGTTGTTLTTTDLAECHRVTAITAHTAAGTRAR